MSHIAIPTTPYRELKWEIRKLFVSDNRTNVELQRKKPRNSNSVIRKFATILQCDLSTLLVIDFQQQKKREVIF